MTAPHGPGSPAGRRANGLAAAEFGALVDLDPRLSEALLDRLRSAGVAAYVEPAGNAQPLVRSVVLPSRPLDRLWVDPDRADAARDVVAAEVADLSALLSEESPGATAHGLVQAVPRFAAHRVLRPPPLPDPPADAPAPEPAPEPPGAVSPEAAGEPADADELFRQIVEGYERDSPGPVPPWPVSEDVDDPGRSVSPERRTRPVDPRDGEPGSPGRRLRRRTDGVDEGGPDDGLPGWLEPDAIDDPELESHYEPPPPPALPRIRGRTAVSALGVLLGLLLAFAPSLLGQVQTTGTLVLGLALMAGGGFGLVTAVRDAPPDETRPDDGAVV